MTPTVVARLGGRGNFFAPNQYCKITSKCRLSDDVCTNITDKEVGYKTFISCTNSKCRL